MTLFFVAGESAHLRKGYVGHEFIEGSEPE